MKITEEIMKKFIIMIVILFITTSCTQNQRSKHVGGIATIILDENKKLINASWKKDNLWVLTTDMNSNDIPKTYIYKEYSSFGVLKGTYIIHEKKSGYSVIRNKD